MRLTENKNFIALDAPAKINLYLQVIGRRSDGYHLLDSLVAFTEKCDCLTATLADSLTLQVTGPFSGSLSEGQDDNLILRAARSLQNRFDIKKGAAVTLQKNLPISAGVGGGSADAAAILRILSELWQIKLDDSELSRIGLSIGADIPVCISGIPSRMSGIGETVVPVDALPNCAIVLINSGEAVPTSSVFAAHDGTFSTSKAWKAPSNFDELVSFLKLQANDLADAARLVLPQISDVLGELRISDGCELARLSGSGGTCFGLFPDVTSARIAADNIQNTNPQWWSVATTFRDTRPEIRSGSG